MSDYIPLGREFELQMRAECPEYREMRSRVANEWRRMRRTYGPQLARAKWRGILDARKMTVRMVSDNMFYQSTPHIGGIGRLLRDADGN